MFSGTNPARAATSGIVYGQVSFLALMTCCLAIKPSSLAVKRGLSYYGTHVETIVPYSLAFVLCAISTALAIWRFPAGSPAASRLKAALVLILVLVAAIPMTPYNADRVVDWLHIGLTTALFSVALLVGAWLACAFGGGRARLWLFAVQAVAASLILVSQVGLLDYMIPSQLLFQIPFALLTVRAVRRLHSQAEAATSSRPTMR